MAVYLGEWNFASQFEGEHDHSRYPEEKDIPSRLQSGGWEEGLQVFGFLRPSQCREWPKSRGKPSLVSLS